MTTIKSDLLDITEGIICHQVNCQRVAGAGLALQIRNKWPEWYRAFKNDHPWLGRALVTKVAHELFVASLYAQDDYGSGKCFTDYNAFKETLSCLKFIIQQREEHAPELPILSIYFPKGIGCGLAGGDWNVIESLIERYFPNAILVEKV